MRQSARRRARNVKSATVLKETLKKYRKSPSAEGLTEVYQKLDKAAKTNLIKKNKASRLKSRLSKRLTPVK
jgi:small subunit ribosomal protein S20